MLSLESQACSRGSAACSFPQSPSCDLKWLSQRGRNQRQREHDHSAREQRVNLFSNKQREPSPGASHSMKGWVIPGSFVLARCLNSHNRREGETLRSGPGRATDICPSGQTGCPRTLLRILHCGILHCGILQEHFMLGSENDACQSVPWLPLCPSNGACQVRMPGDMPIVS